MSLAWYHHFTKRVCFGPEPSLIPTLIIEMSVPRKESERSCIFGKGYRFCLCFYNFSSNTTGVNHLPVRSTARFLVGFVLLDL